MDTSEILERMKRIYSEFDSFREISRVPSSRAEATKGRLDADLEFRLWFKRPSCYRVEAKFVCFDKTEERQEKSSKPHKQFIDRGREAALEFDHFLLLGDENSGTVIQYAGQFERAQRQKIQHFANGRAAIAERKSAARTLSLFEDTPYYLQNIRGIVGFPEQSVGDRMCHHIVVYSSAAYVETHLWIDQQDYLLRKIQQPVHAVLKPALSLLRHAPFKLGDFLSSDLHGDEMNMHTEFIVLETEVNPDIDPFVFESRF
jgi:hypothetical protein